MQSLYTPTPLQSPTDGGKAKPKNAQKKKKTVSQILPNKHFILVTIIYWS